LWLAQEVRPQTFSAPSQHRVRRRHALADQFGDLRDTEPVNMTQDQHRSLVGPQATQSRNHSVVAIVWFDGRRLPTADLVSFTAPPPPDCVEMSMATAGDQPGQTNRVVWVLVHPAHQGGIGLLCQVRRSSGVATGQTERVAIHLIQSLFTESAEISRVQHPEVCSTTIDATEHDNPSND
jgi:hypothetical protein